MTNVIQDPSFELSIGSWRCSRGPTIATPSWEHTDVHSGTGSARLTRTATVDTGVISFNEGLVVYPASLNSSWSGSAWVLVDAPEDHLMNAAILCFNSAGTGIGSIQGPNVNGQAGSWTQVTIPLTALPAGTAFVSLQVNGRGGTWAPGTSWVLDDVYLAQGVTVIVGSLASSKGYGWRRYNVRTDPHAPDGTSYALNWRVGQPGAVGTIDNGAGGGHIDQVTHYLAGTYIAQAVITGWGSGSVEWTVNQIVWTNFTVAGLSLRIGAKWTTSGGDPNGSGADAVIDWGDGGIEEQLFHLDPPTEGDVAAVHYYPLLPDDAEYTVTLRSGPQTITRTAFIPAGTRSILTSEDGLRRARVSIQEWPEFAFSRETSTLHITGRDEPVVLFDTVQLPTSEPIFLTLNAAEHDALLAVLTYHGRIRLESVCPGVESGWFIVTGFQRQRLTNKGSELRRLWPVSIQEVIQP